MVDVEIAPSFGGELKDGFKPVNAWVNNGIAFLEDVQLFYRERSAIEREYSQKLTALAKKYFEKKARKSALLSVGETPTVTPGSLESASMTTWGVHLTTLESRANEHEQYATQLINNIAEPLKTMGVKYDDLRKQHAEYAAKLEREKEGAYGDLRKTKAKYDSTCQETEHRRKKMDGSDYGKSKAQGAYNQQMIDMRNAKNAYLISINVTNRQKERYYHEYVPDLLESLNETRVSTLNNIWSNAANIERQSLTHSLELVDHLIAEIPRNKPALDSMMFVRHNAAQWTDPPDFAFEPSPVWLDDNAMTSDQASKIFLMNILSKSKQVIKPLQSEIAEKRREVDGARKVRDRIRQGQDNRDECEVFRMMFIHQEALHDAERRRITAETEVSTITAAVGDISIGMKNHPFTNQTFKIPTNCDLCGERIWGLSAKGLSCTDCGFTCHLKCELKVAADCPGELDKNAKKAIKVERQAAAANAQPLTTETSHTNGTSQGSRTTPSLTRSDTIGSMNTLSSGYEARSVSGMSAKTNEEPSRNRLVAPPPAVSRNSTSDDAQRGRMLYAYQANADGELTISEGQEFAVIEEDDGSGWLKIKPSAPGSIAGLVPASYAEVSPKMSRSFTSDRPVSTASGSTTSLVASDGAPVKKKGPAVAPRRGAKKIKHVEALYTYTAVNEGEVDMVEGERMILIQADQGDGWCEVESRAGRGIVPSGWCKEV